MRGDGHDQSQASPGCRCSGSASGASRTAFFGLTGLVLRALGWPALAAAAVIAAGVGVAAGLGASADVPRADARDGRAGAGRRARWSGARGRCCCRSRAASAARCGSPSPGGGDVDLLAEVGRRRGARRRHRGADRRGAGERGRGVARAGRAAGAALVDRRQRRARMDASTSFWSELLDAPRSRRRPALSFVVGGGAGLRGAVRR